VVVNYCSGFHYQPKQQSSIIVLVNPFPLLGILLPEKVT